MLTAFKRYEMPTFESSLKFKSLVFCINAFNIIIPTLFYQKIYLIVIFEEKFINWSKKSAFRAIETEYS